jgi:hypothetical protein
MAKLSPKKLTGHFWNEESGLTSMLILLCISNFLVTPFFSGRPVVTLLIRAFWFFLLVAGITTLSKDKSHIRYLSVLPVLLILVSVLGYFLANPVLVYIDFLITLSVLFLLTWMVLLKVFESGPVTIHRVVGAIVTFMLLGNIWAFIYHFVYLHVPGSFQIPGSTEYSIASPVTFLYFSFTTLTTTGYGDIVPLNSLTRTLANIEQLVGVLFPAVLIGRLVSLITDKSK